MRGPYSEYAAPPVYVYRAPPKPGVRFSRTELVQLLVAILGLSAALTILFVNPIYGGSALGIVPGNPTAAVGFFFLTSLVAVASGVGLHEIMHKLVAQRYGYWAEFRYSLRGLAMALMLSLFGFIFGAPGATYIAGPVTQDQNGRISLAGPATNVGLAVAFLGLDAALLPSLTASLPVFLVWLLCEQVAWMNLVLAGFNLIPVMPLDGAKILRWRVGVWVGVLALVIGLFAFGVLEGLLFL